MRRMAISSKHPSLAGHSRHQRVYSPHANCGGQTAQYAAYACRSASESPSVQLETHEALDQAAKPPATAAVGARSWVKANSNAATSASVLTLAALTSLTYEGLSHADLPPVSPAVEALPEVLGVAAAGAAAALAAAKLLLGDKFHIEWHR